MSRTAQFVIYFVLILAPFVTYGALVRRGTIKGRNILLAGIPLGLAAMLLATAQQWPDYAAHRIPIQILLLNALMMLWVTIFCVLMSYRSQRAQDIATFTLGDTRIIVRVVSPSLLPDTDALLLPVNTNLRLNDGLAGMIGTTAGSKTQSELKALGTVGLGKVVEASGGDTKVSRFVLVAVGEALKPIDSTQLRKGMEAAAQRARKLQAESVAVPIGPLRGVSVNDAAAIMTLAVLKHRKAFAEIVFVVLEQRFGPDVKKAVEVAVNQLGPPRETEEILRREG